MSLLDVDQSFLNTLLIIGQKCDRRLGGEKTKWISIATETTSVFLRKTIIDRPGESGSIKKFKIKIIFDYLIN